MHHLDKMPGGAYDVILQASNIDYIDIQSDDH